MNKHETAGFDTRVDSLKESMRNLVDFGSERAGALKGKVKDLKDTMVSRGSTGIDRMVALVKEHPYAAIGIAFGAGYIVLRIARR